MPGWFSFGLGPAMPGAAPAPLTVSGAPPGLMVLGGLAPGDGAELVTGGLCGAGVLGPALAAYLVTGGLGDARSGALVTGGLTAYRLKLPGGIVGDAQARPGVVDANRSTAKGA